MSDNPLAVTIRPPFDSARIQQCRARSRRHRARRSDARPPRTRAPQPGLRPTGWSPGLACVPNDRCSRHAWCNLLEQLQPFPAHAELIGEKAGGVATRPRQARDEAGAHRVDDIREHDRHGARLPLQRRHRRGAGGENDVRRERDQFRRVSAGAVGIARAPAVVDLHVAADSPTQFLQPLCKSRKAALPLRIVQACIMSTPMRRMRSACCARDRSGHETAAPPRRVMNSRRRIIR